jgi:hypothetical protein
MTNTPTPALELLAELSDRATPGEWLADGRYIGTSSHMSSVGECRDQNGNWSNTAKSTANAALMAAACNYLRTHGARIAELEGDAEKWHAFTAGIDADQVVSASEKFGDALGLLRDAARYRWLRDSRGPVTTHIETWRYDLDKYVMVANEEADAAIDAAMALATSKGADAGEGG